MDLSSKTDALSSDKFLLHYRGEAYCASIMQNKFFYRDLGADALTFRVPERHGLDFCAHRFSKDLDLQLGTGFNIGHWQVSKGDALINRVTKTASRHPRDDVFLASRVDRLLA